MPNLPTKLSVDFTGVERGGGAVGAHVPEGDYLLRVVGADLKSKKDDPSSKYLSWRCTIVKPTQYAGKTIYHTTSLKQEALWNLRGFLMDLLGGADKVPQKALDIPLQKIVAAKKLLGATLQDDEYNGKFKSVIAATFAPGDYADDGSTSDSKDDEEETTSTSASSDDEDLDEIDVDDL